MDCHRIIPLFRSVLLIAAAAAAYVGALKGAFQYDDFYSILINPHLDGWTTFVGHLDHMVRPLLHATFLFDRSVYGNDPSGYHVLNLLLHLGSGLLIYRILTRVVTEELKHVPFWTALLFLVHPIQTEAVTYISGRASSLMAFFSLLALALYDDAAVRRRQAKPYGPYLVGALVSFICALGSKETAMTLPIALLLWDWLVRQVNGVTLRQTVLSVHLPFWVVLMAATTGATWHPRYSTLAQFSLEIRPLWDNFLSQLNAVTYALLLLFCPWKQNFDHDLPVLHSLFEWPLPIDLLVLGALATAAIAAAKHVPLFTFSIGWFFIQLFPTTFIPRNDLLSERNLYLSSIGLLLAIVILGLYLMEWFARIVPRPRIIRFGSTGAAVLLVLVLCAFTYERNVLYSDPVLLWSDTIKKSPHKARPHNNLGHAYALQDNWERALEEFRIAVQLDPDYALAKRNLRDAYLHQVGRL
ncbi:MAG: tetratricopeptide repeat protein [Nitrospira sp.]|nr:tetratricopeptide repeat protein [Nitrospira sp.]